MPPKRDRKSPKTDRKLPPNLKRITYSCDSCRRLKRKCDQGNPCSNCAKRNLECTRPVSDLRSKRRLSQHEYVNDLAGRISQLQKIVDSYEKDGIVPDYIDNNNDEDDDQSHKDLEIAVPIPMVAITDFLEFENLYDPWIFSCISNFFLWRYPDIHLFIHRESFLNGFFQNKGDLSISSHYCSEELIYAICSLSSDIDYDDTSKISSLEFYHKAKSLIFEKLPQDGTSKIDYIPFIQAILCISVYDLGRGDLSSAWRLSGIAFRLIQALEIEKDPVSWKIRENLTRATEYDISIKKKIYLGFYIIDNLISLIQDRGSVLKYPSYFSTLPDVDNEPDFNGIENFIYFDPLNEDFDEKLNIIQDLKYEVQLYQIIQGSVSTNMVDKMTQFSKKRIIETNESLKNWRNEVLSQDYRWTIEDLREQGHNTRLISFRLHYYLTVLNFNKPFIISKEPRYGDELIKFSREAINEVQLIFERFNEIESTYEAHEILAMVYVTIFTLTILSSIGSEITDDIIGKIKFFMKVLEKLSKTWKLADKYYRAIGQIKLDGKTAEESKISCHSLFSSLAKEPLSIDRG